MIIWSSSLKRKLSFSKIFIELLVVRLEKVRHSSTARLAIGNLDCFRRKQSETLLVYSRSKLFEESKSVSASDYECERSERLLGDSRCALNIAQTFLPGISR